MLAVLTPNARAQMLEERERVTFSGPVEVPGEVLPAGSYVFEALENGHLTRILSADETHVYATLFTVPDEQRESVEKATIVLGEGPKGSPERVKEWFFPGDSTGNEFIFQKARSRRDRASITGDPSGKPAAPWQHGQTGCNLFRVRGCPRRTCCREFERRDSPFPEVSGLMISKFDMCEIFRWPELLFRPPESYRAAPLYIGCRAHVPQFRAP